MTDMCSGTKLSRTSSSDLINMGDPKEVLREGVEDVIFQNRGSRKGKHIITSWTVELALSQGIKPLWICGAPASQEGYQGGT